MLAHAIYPYMNGIDTSKYTTLMRDPNGSYYIGDPFQKNFRSFDELKSYMRENGWPLSDSVTPDKVEYLKLNWLWRSPKGIVTIADSLPYLYSVPTPCMSL